MTGLLLFSHGSLLCGAGAALDEHAARLRRDHGFGLVEAGYLNYTEPLFDEAVARLASAGASRIVVVPFFLAPGYFVTHSLPKCIDTVQPAYPGLDFVIAEPLGGDPRLADAILESAGAAKSCADPPRPSATPPASGGGRESSVVLADPPPPEAGGVARAKRSDGVGQSSLLVMAHGSPTPGANDDMYRVLGMVKERAAFGIVEAGFLECNQPALPEAIESCVRQGAKLVVAVPYFLHMGNHVAGDLPAKLEEAQASYPDAEFRMGEYIGRSGILTGLLAERAQEALAKRSEKYAGKA